MTIFECRKAAKMTAMEVTSPNYQERETCSTDVEDGDFSVIHDAVLSSMEVLSDVRDITGEPHISSSQRALSDGESVNPLTQSDYLR